MSTRRFLPALLLILTGCETPAETEPPGPDVVACTDYCEAAKDVSCPKNGKCMDDCLSLFPLGCPDQLIDLLACAAPALTDECVPRDANGMLACINPLADYDNCLPFDFGVSPVSCGASTGESASPAEGCHGEVKCDGLELSVDCDAGGACTCARNGETVGTCDNVLSSAYLCAPHRSCCTPFFAPD